MSLSKITLSMIVKNEAHIIERCLESVKTLISSVCIIDTGSDENDKTISNSLRWCETNKIPCFFEHIKFTNFAETRNQALEVARLKFPDTGYFLVLDADMILSESCSLEELSEFLKSDKSDGYTALQTFGQEAAYSNVRLISSSSDWRYVSAIHEFLHNSNPFSKVSHLSLLNFYDFNDGGSRSTAENRLERYKHMLIDAKTKLINDNDLLKRYTFYLGRTHFDMKQYELAIDEYKSYLTLPNLWDQEKFIAYYDIGQCYWELNQKLLALEHFYKACSVDNRRAEPYFYIFMYLNALKCFDLIHNLRSSLYEKIEFQKNNLAHFLFNDIKRLNFSIKIELAVATQYLDTKQFSQDVNCLNELQENVRDFSFKHFIDGLYASPFFLKNVSD